MLWLALPPLALFAALPLEGQRAIPHWFNSGWLFAYPLCGAWLAERGAVGLRRWAKAAAALSAATIALFVPAVLFGLGPLLPSGMRDPTAYAYDWPSIAKTSSWGSGGAPAFVLVDNWRVGGRVGEALGPATPICGFGPDPRGFAFTCAPKEELGKDALIVAPENAAARTFAAAAPHFESLEAPETFVVGRMGRPERVLEVLRARTLREPDPLPHGPGR